MPGEVVVDRTEKDEDENTVMRVFVRKTDSEAYLSDFRYRLHFGTFDDETLLRYDNSHGVHERHPPDDGEEIEFPGMDNLLEKFYREVEEIREKE